MNSSVTKVLGSPCKVMFWDPNRILQRVITWCQSVFGPPRIQGPPTMRGVRYATAKDIISITYATSVRQEIAFPSHYQLTRTTFSRRIIHADVFQFYFVFLRHPFSPERMCYDKNSATRDRLLFSLHFSDALRAHDLRNKKPESYVPVTNAKGAEEQHHANDASGFSEFVLLGCCNNPIVSEAVLPLKLDSTCDVLQFFVSFTSALIKLLYQLIGTPYGMGQLDPGTGLRPQWEASFRFRLILTESPLVRLVEGEKRWESPDHSQGVLPLNWGKTELNRSVTCMGLKATANDRRHLALCHDEFRRP
ncbi:uncharacterized protein TNCV_2531441 [Trichonephila clavipes]|nr:uncharacterized protein TNCV_2531441 [Trichonephila clavipes]